MVPTGISVHALVTEMLDFKDLKAVLRVWRVCVKMAKEALTTAAILMFLPENANGWGQEDFSKSQIHNEKQGSLAKGTALIENNFHVAKHCVISKVCVQSRGLGILICETCSCSTSDLGCVFM